MTNNFLDALNFRHACKIFDDSKTINDESLNFIMESARKSPSSFGMEGWKFLVISNKELREKLKPLCWNQPQITTSSHLVVVLANIDSLKPSSGEPKKRFERRGLPQESVEKYIDLYSSHLKDTLSSDENIYHWSAKQTYIALGNMMTSAAYIGVDSCAIEGFEKENIEKLLDIDTTKHQVAVLLALGYRVNEQSTQQRLPFEDVVEFIR